MTEYQIFRHLKLALLPTHLIRKQQSFFLAYFPRYSFVYTDDLRNHYLIGPFDLVLHSICTVNTTNIAYKIQRLQKRY